MTFEDFRQTMQTFYIFNCDLRTRIVTGLNHVANLHFTSDSREVVCTRLWKCSLNLAWQMCDSAVIAETVQHIVPHYSEKIVQTFSCL
jgi:hypothetical protein